VVSYNLLACAYADTDYAAETLFPYVEAVVLDGAYRQQLIVEELRGYHADVLCLQVRRRKKKEKRCRCGCCARASMCVRDGGGQVYTVPLRSMNIRTRTRTRTYGAGG
jgi:hypothetical protein